MGMIHKNMHVNYLFFLVYLCKCLVCQISVKGLSRSLNDEWMDYHKGGTVIFLFFVCSLNGNQLLREILCSAMVLILMACLPCLADSFFGPSGLIYMTSVVKFLHLCFHAVISFLSDRRSAEIENENNNKKTLTTEVSYMGLESLERI